MGLLDGILSAAMSSMQSANASGAGAQAGAQAGAMPAAGGLNAGALMNIVGSLMNQQGGLSGLLGKLNQAGLGDVAKSWVGTGQNLPISGAQVEQVLGSGQLSQIASQLGVDPSRVGGLLSQVLPHVVDQLTPQGQVPQGNIQGDALTSALGAIAGKLFSGR